MRTVKGWKRLALLPLVLLTGCQGMTGAGKGALAGGAAGAVAGNLIAKGTHGSRTAGTAIGGVVGAIGGAIVGDSMDQQRAKGRAEGRAQAVAQQNSMRAPTVDDIISMRQGGASEQVLIDQIRSTHATYQLTTTDVMRLTSNGVPDSVVREMQGAAPVTVVRPVYQPVIVEERPVIVREPAPVTGIGVGFSYSSRGR